MTDNEKRAHDFAIALLPITAKLKVNELAQSGEVDIRIDYYKEYLQYYQAALSAFDRDFPNGGK